MGRFQHVEPTSRVHVSLKEGRSRPDACEPLIWPSPQMQAGASAMLVISIPFGVQKLGFQPTRFMSIVGQNRHVQCSRSKSPAVVAWIWSVVSSVLSLVWLVSELVSICCCRGSSMYVDLCPS